MIFPSYGNQKAINMCLCAIRHSLLGAFAKLRKATIGFFMSVRPSPIRTE